MFLRKTGIKVSKNKFNFIAHNTTLNLCPICQKEKCIACSPIYDWIKHRYMKLPAQKYNQHTPVTWVLTRIRNELNISPDIELIKKILIKQGFSGDDSFNARIAPIISSYSLEYIKGSYTYLIQNGTIIGKLELCPSDMVFDKVRGATDMDEIKDILKNKLLEP